MKHGTGFERAKRAMMRRGTTVAACVMESLRPPSPPPQPDASAPSILFVCHGNICRSPLAEGTLQHELSRHGLDRRIAVASAGTNAIEGTPPDVRARLVAAWHGFRIDRIRARRFRADDLGRFDRILVFDRATREVVLAHARSDDHRRRVALVASDDVEDPVCGSLRDFNRTYRVVAAACARLVADVR